MIPAPHIPPSDWPVLLECASDISGYGQLLLELIWYMRNVSMVIIGVLLSMIVAITWRG